MAIKEGDRVKWTPPPSALDDFGPKPGGGATVVKSIGANRWRVRLDDGHEIEAVSQELTAMSATAPRAVTMAINSGSCPYCGASDLLVTSDGKLPKHDARGTGGVCYGSGKVAKMSRAVTMANGAYKAGERVKLRDGKSGVVENSDYDSHTGHVVVLVKVDDGSRRSVNVVDLDATNMSRSPYTAAQMARAIAGARTMAWGDDKFAGDTVDCPKCGAETRMIGINPRLADHNTPSGGRCPYSGKYAEEIK